MLAFTDRWDENGTGWTLVFLLFVLYGLLPCIALHSEGVQRGITITTHRYPPINFLRVHSIMILTLNRIILTECDLSESYDSFGRVP